MESFAGQAATSAALAVAAAEAASLPVDALTDTLSALLEGVEISAAALGDTLLVSAIRLVGGQADPLGITPKPSDLVAARKAAATTAQLIGQATRQETAQLVDETETTDLDKLPRQRAARTARGRATQRLGHYYDLGLSGQPAVRGYRRGLDADPCELCVWLWRDGFTYPKGQAMHRHPQCSCIAVPVLQEAS